MRRGRFVEERSGEWTELEDLLVRSNGRPERLGPDAVRRAGALYRAASADLGLARRAFPADPVTARLQALVVRGRQAVYADEPRRASVVEFLTRTYFRRIRERPGLLLLSIALITVPTVLAWIWGAHDPAAAIGVIPGRFARHGHPVAGTLTSTDQAGFAGEIFTNNIRVTFMAVAAGVTLGIGTAALAIYNGTFLGALGGVSFHDGTGDRFVSLVIGHGVLELSCIAVGTLAGLRLGWSIVEPGRRTRLESLRAEARPAIELVLGTMPWLVLAGLVEGFFTGSAPALVPAVILGVSLGAVFWALVWWRGSAEVAEGVAHS
ncbi:MAG: hypothetical protein QOF76_4517 [Solirubrobacteraceae bacterium]|jgi:uncharacterized membrane protein SpoIIM required for sporulation|nr:hypothetical protein [Solirubrobacteraceae bacterium]